MLNPWYDAGMQDIVLLQIIFYFILHCHVLAFPGLKIAIESYLSCSFSFSRLEIAKSFLVSQWRADDGLLFCLDVPTGLTAYCISTKTSIRELTWVILCYYLDILKCIPCIWHITNPLQPKVTILELSFKDSPTQKRLLKNLVEFVQCSLLDILGS